MKFQRYSSKTTQEQCNSGSKFAATRFLYRSRHHPGYRDAEYDILAGVLNKILEITTSNNEKPFADVMSNGLLSVADTVGLDRIAVYRVSRISTKASQNRYSPLEEEYRIGQIYVWAHGKTSNMDEKLLELPMFLPMTCGWLGILTRGDCLNRNVREMSASEAAFCDILGIKSLLLVPIFTHNEFWGFVALEDHTRYRYFEDHCLDLLRSAARL